MKKLLTVLCVAACGFGAAAQAQVVQARDSEQRIEIKNLEQKLPASFMEMPVAEQARLMQAKARGAYDTLHWHDEYTNEDCDNYYSLLPFGVQTLFGSDRVLSPFGASYSGTGEVGATYQTENNLYNTYAGIGVTDAWVVGAVAYAYRIGSTAGWERVGTETFDPNHMSEVGGVKVPNLPYKIKGYPRVQKQQGYASYYDAIFNQNEHIVELEMPVSMQDAVETPIDYMGYFEPQTLSDGRAWPQIQRIGGMFEQVFPAWVNFGISVEAQLTNNMTYDSLWNWSIAAKSNNQCTFIDDWGTWQRLDFSDPMNRWVWLYKNDNSAIDVSKPFNAEDDDWGFAPDDCPQHDNGSLYVYAFSLHMTLADGEHFQPMLYPVIQNRTSIEREKDTYAQTVSVYPLPATDKATIVAIDAMQKVELFNMAGTLVNKFVMNDNVLELDVTSYAPGTYVAKITTEKGVVSKKLLVK